MPSLDQDFEDNRTGLTRLAYRMLGSLSDAEDVVQDAYLKWTRATREDVRLPRAYLYSIVTNLCINQRTRIEARKERYIGPWLPEPLVDSYSADPSQRLEATESVSLAFLVVLESLSPLERAAYLLRKVFDYEYHEIAEILGKTEPNCRQLVSRAEERVHARRPRFETNPSDAARITETFLNAIETGDLQSLVELLATDAVLYSDGGGKVPAALVPIRGANAIARLLVGLRKKSPNLERRLVRVNGQPGLLIVEDGHVVNIMTLDIIDGYVATCYIIRNPDKLTHISV